MIIVMIIMKYDYFIFILNEQFNSLSEIQSFRTQLFAGLLVYKLSVVVL